MDAPHPTSSSRYPPDEETFAGSLMLRLARGTDEVADLREWVDDVVDDFADTFPAEPELDHEGAAAVLEAVVAEHERCVPEASPDTRALLGVLEALPGRGIAVSLGEAFDAAEGAEAGYAASTRLGPAARGYVYAHTQDLDRLVLTGELYLGYSGTAADDAGQATTVGTEVSAVLRAAGLPLTWDGDPRSRLLVGPITWARPLADGPVAPSGDGVRTEQEVGPARRSWWGRLRGR